jgi:D-lactate dehydrogenase
MNSDAVTYKYISASLSLETAAFINDMDAVSIFVTDSMDETLLKKLKDVGVKYLITRSAGMDHIDLDACKKIGIKTANVPNYGPETIAEHTLMLTLCLLRKCKKIQANIHEGDYRLDELLSETIYGKTVGVIGTGSIGSRYAKMMHALGATVLGFDILRDRVLEDNKILRYVEMNQLYREADIISLHLPLTKETRYLFSEDTLKLLKKKPWIINTARGGLVDTRAMIHALKQNRVSGYATDVYEYETGLFFQKHEQLPLPDSLFNKLLLESNALVTPHLAFAGRVAIQNMMQQMHETLQKWALSNETAPIIH